MYEIIAEIGLDVLHKEDAMVCTKYTTMEKKVKLSARPLPASREQKRKEVSGYLTLLNVGILVPLDGIRRSKEEDSVRTG